MGTRGAARRARRAARLAFALLLAVGATAAAQAETADEASVAAKREGSPVDPRLAVWAGARERRGAGAPDAWPLILREDGIVINAASNGDPRALLAELEAIGLREGAVSGNAISGLLPFDAIDALASCGSLAVARPAMATTSRGLAARVRPDRARGSVTSQGVAAMRVDRLPRSVDGAGTSVGILADSFDCIGGGRAQDTASGDIPPDVAILDDTNVASCLDEGRALAQVVHDVAPRSRLGFHTAFSGQADFAEGIRELARDFGADVIVDDVLYFDEPFFQDGPIARAIDTVHDQGVAYVSAAGNAGRRSYEAPFRDSGQTGFFQGLALAETRRHDFDPGPGVDVFQTLTLPPFAFTILILQWDEPFVSASTTSPPVGAASDYDLMVYKSETPLPMRFADVFARSSAFNPPMRMAPSGWARRPGSRRRALASRPRAGRARAGRPPRRTGSARRLPTRRARRAWPKLVPAASRTRPPRPPRWRHAHWRGRSWCRRPRCPIRTRFRSRSRSPSGARRRARRCRAA